MTQQKKPYFYNQYITEVENITKNNIKNMRTIHFLSVSTILVLCFSCQPLTRDEVIKQYSETRDLNDANLHFAELQDADLSGADLRRADLSGAYLRNTDLTGANLLGANLENADLSVAKPKYKK